MTGLPELVDKAVRRLRDVAPAVDTEGDVEGATISILRDEGLLSYLVPRELGGWGGDLDGMVTIAAELGGACLGAAVVWVMHCQQVVMVDRHAGEPLRTTVLRGVADRRHFLASVTTEPGKGGHLLTAAAGLRSDGSRLRFHRDAPVVSGGAHADAFLISMRRQVDGSADDVTLVYCERQQAGPQLRHALDMLGMRAAGNVSMTFDADVPADQLIDPPGGFARIVSRAMAPTGHLGWAACWVGAGREAMRLLVGELRRRRASSDLLAARVARARCDLDLAEALLLAALAEYRRLAESDVDRPAAQILINNVKVGVSERVFAAVDGIVEAGGLAAGYLRRADLPLERILRDMRSASLMYANDRLLLANGKLALLDRDARSFTTWAGAEPWRAG